VGLPYSALPIAITVEGANILTRTLIVFGQGAIRCHPYVLKEMEAASDTNDARALDSFDSAVFGHIGFTLSNTVRTLFYGLTGARLGMGGGGALKRYYLASSRITAIFTLTADVVMGVFGGGLKRKEMISGRLADAFSNLYMATAVLKRYEDDGRPEGDWPLVQWSMETALHEAQNALIGVFDNIPIRIVGWKLKALAFPWGRSYSGPSDRLSLKVASLIMEPSETRDRLTADIHKPSDAADPVGRMEDAMLKVIAAEPIEKILREAVKKGEVTAGDETTMIDEALTKGVLTHDQGEALKAASLARLSVITVDDFPLDFESGSAMS
jgi:acyl-CoA dehydrogenase